MVKVRLIGPPERVEAITRDIRREWGVVEEQDYPCRRDEGLVRRYLVIAEGLALPSPDAGDGRGQGT